MPAGEFLAWERAQELSFEFDGRQPIPTGGGTLGHSAIALNVLTALNERLARPCRAFKGDVTVVVEDRVRYPDGVVSCSAVRMSDDIVPDAVLIVEVLSASSAIVDTTIKADEYCAIPSLRYDLMVEQDRIEATLLSRDGDGWAERTLCGLDAVLPLPPSG